MITKILSLRDREWWYHNKNKPGRGTNSEGKILHSKDHHKLKGTQGIPGTFEDSAVEFIESFLRACGQCLLLPWQLMDYTIFHDEKTFVDSFSQKSIIIILV